VQSPDHAFPATLPRLHLATIRFEIPLDAVGVAFAHLATQTIERAILKMVKIFPTG